MKQPIQKINIKRVHSAETLCLAQKLNATAKICDQKDKHINLE